MSGVRFIASSYDALAQALFAGADSERCAIGFAHHDPAADAWVVAEAAPVADDAYLHRDQASAVLKPAVLVAAANHARAEGLSPILVHTHPHAAGVPAFSRVDDTGEVEIKAFFDRRAPQAQPLALVVGPEGARARKLGTHKEVPVWSVGPKLRALSAGGSAVGDSRHDRQVRAFGSAGQHAIAGLRLLVVGAGGTGSATVQQLAHLGTCNLTVIDPDRVEVTNLNRLIGATPADVGTPKVEVARRLALAINPAIDCRAVVGDIVDADQAALIAGFDLVFLCTDSHASRMVVGQAAYQHLVPAIDMGVSISVSQGRVTHINGRVQMLAPGLPCLTCTGALDAEQIRRELMTPEQRAADPYVIGGHVPQPAVISLNCTMASLAVTMFLGAVTGVPAQARFQLYDGLRGMVRPTTATIRDKCIVCSSDGALAKAASWTLPVRPQAVQHG